MRPRSTSGYREILKSSAVIGGSSIMVLAIGILRTKLFAMLLGPAGFGLMAALTSLHDLARSVAELGISRSGVRQIAEAAGADDGDRVARVAAVLRRVTFVLGLAGAVVLALMAAPVARVSFGVEGHAGDVQLLAIATFCGVVAGGYGALLQGLRRIGDLAKVGILSAVIGLLFGVPIVWVYGEDGVVLSVIATAATSAVSSWWYGRRLGMVVPCLTTREMGAEVGQLLRLGAAFLISGLLMMAAAYCVRIIVLRFDGIDSAGLYHAGWTLGGMYVGFILQAMGTDFYPRLVAAAQDSAECNRRVNEQAQVSVLLAGPGVIATLVFAPTIMVWFYSSSFVAASEFLRWVCVGMALRVVTWPMGFIIVAKNRQRCFILVEVAWTVFNVAASWLLVEHFGLNGAGLAFFASYVFHALLVYPIVRKMTGFRLDPDNARATFLFIAMVGMSFAAVTLIPGSLGMLVGALALAVNCFYSARRLIALAGEGATPAVLSRLAGLIRSIRVRCGGAGSPAIGPLGKEKTS